MWHMQVPGKERRCALGPTPEPEGHSGPRDKPVRTSLSGLVPSAGASTGCVPAGELEEAWVTCRAPSRALPELPARLRKAFPAGKHSGLLGPPFRPPGCQHQGGGGAGTGTAQPFSCLDNFG